MSTELQALKQLMPKGYNWSGVESGVISEILQGLSKQMERDSDYSDLILNNYLPFDTEFYTEQEEMFRLPTTNITNDQRLERIKSSWSNIAPTTYTGFNELLALNGFDDIVARPLTIGEDPTLITDYYKLFTNGILGSIINDYDTALGRAILGADSGTSNLAQYTGSAEYYPEIIIPSDSNLWGMIFVLEATDGTVAEINDNLKSSFEFLIYKMKPLFMMGIARVSIAEYIAPAYLAIDDDDNLTTIDNNDSNVLIQGCESY